MISFYKNNPTTNEILVVQITESHKIPPIKCKLLEYSGISGLICKLDCNKKAIKKFNKYKIGDIIVVICDNVNNMSGIINIDLIYGKLDATQIQFHINRYNRFSKIINLFTIISCDEHPDIDIPFSDALTNEIIMNDVEVMMSETLYPLESKDEIDRLFHSNNINLHKVALSWTKCNEYSKFIEHLYKTYPLPSIEIYINMSFSTTKCFGTKVIKSFITYINQKLLELDIDITNQLIIPSPPFFNFKLSSINLTFDNIQSYITIFEQYVIEKSIDPQIKIAIISIKNNISDSC